MPKIVDHEARRRELSLIAARLIARGGLEAATVRAVATDSGYSKGIVEHYFDGKGELINGALQSANQNYEARAREMVGSLTGLSALRARLHASLPLTEAIRDEWRVRLVVWSLATIDPAMKKEQAARFDRAVRRFVQDLETAVELGEIQALDDGMGQARRILFSTSGLCCSALHNPLHDNAMMLKEVDCMINRLASGG